MFAPPPSEGMDRMAIKLITPPDPVAAGLTTSELGIAPRAARVDWLECADVDCNDVVLITLTAAGEVCAPMQEYHCAAHTAERRRQDAQAWYGHIAAHHRLGTTCRWQGKTGNRMMRNAWRSRFMNGRDSACGAALAAQQNDAWQSIWRRS